MNVSARNASAGDLPVLLDLYALLETEMIALKPLWDVAEGLAAPVAGAFERLLDHDSAAVWIGEIDEYPLGFLVGVLDPLLPQAEGSVRASIRYIFTEEPAREVGIAEAMMDSFLAWAAVHGAEHLDAHVSPGHRLAKNFFEANGFKARHIVMYRAAED